jgi:hypothetical protein
MRGHMGAIGLASLAGVLTAVALVFATGVASSAPPDARASASSDVRRVLAPLTAFNRAAVRRRAELQPLGEAWQTTLAPCVQTAYEDIRGRRKSGEFTAEQRELAEALIFLVTVYDTAQDVGRPLDGTLAAAERSYRRMTLRDRVLRTGARSKAKELSAWRKLGDVDTCRFAGQWAQRNYSILNVPDLAPGVQLYDDIGGRAATRAVARAAKRLRKLGASKRRAAGFESFPVERLFEEAARMLPQEVLPPSL